MRCECEGKLHEVLGSLALQCFNRFNHLKGVTYGIAERSIHIGDECADALACTLTDGYHQLCKRAAVLKFFHKGSATRLYVKHDAIIVGGKLFAHNAGSNEGHTVNRCGNVAQSVKHFVGRGERCALSYNGNARLVDDSFKLVYRQAGAKTGNGFELIDGSARVTESATAHFGNGETERCHDRGNDQAGLVANATRGVLIYAQTLDARGIEAFARIAHRQGKFGSLLVAHAAEIDCHAKCGGLIIGDFALAIAFYKSADLLGRQSVTVALLFNYVIHSHRFHSPFRSEEPKDVGSSSCKVYAVVFSVLPKITRKVSGSQNSRST